MKCYVDNVRKVYLQTVYGNANAIFFYFLLYYIKIVIVTIFLLNAKYYIKSLQKNIKIKCTYE